jgi:hypothetical protein
VSEQSPQVLGYDAAAYWYARDAGHLKTLSICHYIWGALTAVLSCMFLVHVGIGIAVVNGRMSSGAPPANQPPAWFGWIFIVMGSFALLLGWAIAAGAIYSGYCMRTRRHWFFSNIIAGIACLWVPLGTVLGVFTIVILQRESVKALYGRPTRIAPPPFLARPPSNP